MQTQCAIRKIERETDALLALPNPPTAIFFSCDAVARSGYRAIARRGLSIPRDVSVVGFDNDPLVETARTYGRY